MTIQADSTGKSGIVMEHRVCVAPMMDHTDRHFRYFLRLIAPRIGLYTEMLAARAVLHGDPDDLLEFDPSEHPVALQLGGSEPDELARAVAIAAPYGYDEINLNAGCPSDRVQSGRFGACLMLEPDRVADCVQAIREAGGKPVSVKLRTGVDEHDSYEFLADFVSRVAGAGCRTFIVHARKALLKGLSPKENRSVPPLEYSKAHRLKLDFPDLRIIVNGGLKSADQVMEQLKHVDGAMIGRQACTDPYWLAGMQRQFIAGGAHGRILSREELVRRMAEYAAGHIVNGGRMHQITRHMLGLYAGVPGAARWRRFLSEHARAAEAGPEILLAALESIDAAA